MTLTLKPKTEIMVPTSVRRKAGLKPGDQVDFRVSGRTITIVPRPTRAAEEHVAGERRSIDRGIAASERDYREGRAYGPFKTHGEFIDSLHGEAAKLSGARKKK
jgi:AbrB family looped-hinge helix DNA binding protein